MNKTSKCNVITVPSIILRGSHAVGGCERFGNGWQWEPKVGQKQEGRITQNIQRDSGAVTGAVGVALGGNGRAIITLHT